MHQASRPTQFGIGASLRRHEDPALISGKGRFVADLVPEGALHAFVLRSAVAHGRFTLHGLAAARAADGVADIITGADVTRLGTLPCLGMLDNADGSTPYVPPYPVLPLDRVRHVGEALAMGDVSENAELDAARERESRLKEAAKEIMDELKRVKVIDPATVDASAAGFGTKVTLKREDGKTKIYTILGRYEADHENFIISNESPIAQGILGKKPGDVASVETPEGAVQYEVISVDRAE